LADNAAVTALGAEVARLHAELLRWQLVIKPSGVGRPTDS
jgi:hypothetical protein